MVSRESTLKQLSGCGFGAVAVAGAGAAGGVGGSAGGKGAWTHAGRWTTWTETRNFTE